MNPAKQSPSVRDLRRLGRGLVHPAPSEAHARLRDEAWLGATLAAMLATIPAFYVELLPEGAPWRGLAALAYGVAALVLAGNVAHVAAATARPLPYLARNWLDGLQILGLLSCTVLPPSESSTPALSLRLAVASLTLVRMLWALRRLVSRASVTYLLVLAAVLLTLCGFGYYWIDPGIKSVSDGLWLAFVTAATVGYGDLVPTTTASRIFSIFVVLLGFGVLSLVTATIAAMFVESEERRMESLILHDLHREVQSLRKELRALRGQAADPPA